MIRRFRARPLPPKILVGIVILVVLSAAVWFYFKIIQDQPKVTDFDSCVAAGNPVLETYPEQCTHKGESYFRPNQAPYDPKQDLVQ